jgi:hypothetical protein
MKIPTKSKCWYFVDEAGDSTFFDRRGNCIVGEEGCSPILVLGFIQVLYPEQIRRTLAQLQAEIAADTYLAPIPSIKKTLRAFHAKDDCPEVRHALFRALSKLDFRAQFVVARKSERIFRNRFGCSQNRFYDELVGRLFENVLHRHAYNHVYFARRGSRRRQAPLEEAIQSGIRRFEEKWNTRVKSEVTVDCQSPVGESCLQVIDYLNWAVQRAYIRREMRYYQAIADKVDLLVDIYDTKKYPKTFYTNKNPFHIEKISPLELGPGSRTHGM